MHKIEGGSGRNIGDEEKGDHRQALALRRKDFPGNLHFPFPGRTSEPQGFLRSRYCNYHYLHVVRNRVSGSGAHVSAHARLSFRKLGAGRINRYRCSIARATWRGALCATRGHYHMEIVTPAGFTRAAPRRGRTSIPRSLTRRRRNFIGHESTLVPYVHTGGMRPVN